MNLKTGWSILRQTAKEFTADNALRLSAALAYYSVFSLAPLLLITMAIAGAVVGEEAARGQLQDQLRSGLGASGAFAVQDMVAHARKPGQNALASIVGVAMLLFGAGGVFGQLQDALNTIWGVKSKSGRGLLGLLKDRFLSFTMVLGTAFLLLVSMVLTAALEFMSKRAESIVQLPAQVWAVIGILISFCVIVFLFAAIFQVLPDAQVKWRHVWVGAIFTAALFVAGKFGIGWYLGREATASAYGTAGALALVLLWVYYSAMILLFGAEFTQVWANRQGAAIQPDADSEFINPVEDQPDLVQDKSPHSGRA
jgi:membrane protein